MLSPPTCLLWLIISAGLATAQVAPRWVDKETRRERYAPLLAYDASRERVVTFGGTDAFRATTTWSEWDGAHWFDVGALSGAVAGALVADRSRHVVLLVNGGRTWVLDGEAFREHPNSLPAGLGVGVDDEVRGRVVLLWRPSATAPMAEVWEWNGATYTLVANGAHVTTGTSVAAAWHGGLGRTLHLRATSPSLAEVWGWDGVAWRREAGGAGAPRLPNTTLAYDSARDRLVLVGGARDATSLEVWEWDRQQWTKVATSGLAGRMGFGLAYDAARGECILYGGYDSMHHELAETWAFDGRAWSLRFCPPQRRNGHALVGDRQRGVVVMFGGATETGPLADTWEWDGVTWRARATSGPPARNLQGMAYDTARGRTVLFGGVGGQLLFLDDTWEWDGQAWLAHTPAVRPLGRAMPALAYDSTRSRTVLFGGNAFGGQHRDTWEWDGAQWTQRQPATTPPGGLAVMAHDPVRGRTVMVSLNGAAVPITTWEWDGVNWQQRFPGGAPTLLTFFSLAWDEGRARVVLTGAGRPEMWEYDGTAWTVRHNDAPVEIQGGAPIAWHAPTRRLVAFGGRIDLVQGGMSPATWVFGDTVEGVATPYGTGCGGARIPLLARRGRSAPGNARYAIDLMDAAPSAPAVLLLASAPAAMAFGPCTLHVAPSQLLATSSASASANGFASFPLPIPRGPWLIGTTLYAQAASVDPSAPLGLALTGGLRIPIGD